jgi:hypothetical protein
MKLKHTVEFDERDMRLALVYYFSKNGSYDGFVINANDIDFVMTEVGAFSAGAPLLEKGEVS